MLPIIVFGIFLQVGLSPLWVRFLGRKSEYILILFPFFAFAYFIFSSSTVMHGTSISYNLPWFNDFGIQLSFYLDGLSLLMSMLITGIGVLIIFYSAGYLKNHPYFRQYYSYLFLFMGAMLGLVLANNLITLFIFWELTSISSYLLIAFDHEKIVARDAALQALLITMVGGLCLLVGFLLIGKITNTYTISQLAAQANSISKNHWYSVILLLILIGAFTKSAQFPFYFWLPDAMVAPTPISAYLHSATMVQAGIYLLARVHPLLAHTQLWSISLTTIGGITMIGGALLALRQTDMKLILAYSTIWALGSLTFMLASDQEMVIKAVVAFLFAHALYKCALFMAAGSLQYETGTRDLRKLHGLHAEMPITFITVLIAAASMAGLPPLLGFYVKELIYEANLAAPVIAQILTIIIVLSNIIMAMLGFFLVLKPFWGRKKMKRIHEPAMNMWLSGLLLVLGMLIISMFPFLIDQRFLAPAASAVLGKTVSIHLALWHGFTPSFALSLITIMGAYILYLFRKKIANWLNNFKLILYHGPSYVYHQLILNLMRFAEWQTHIIQCGKLRIYLTVTFFTIACMLVGSLIFAHLPIVTSPTPIPWFTLFLIIWILAAAIAVLFSHQFLTALVFLGTFGMGVALFFLFNAAPDVAMTQVLVEILFVVIVVLTLYREQPLPKVKPEKWRITIFNTAISLAIGMSITMLLIAATSQTFNYSISDYFINHSLSLGHGHNVVNVILIDFRAFDTLGEIIVLVIAALGIYGLLKSKSTGKWL